MDYDRYYILPPREQVKNDEQRYLINEFRTIKHDGHIYYAQAFKYVSDNQTKWCRCGIYHANMINIEMKQHIQDWYILNDKRYEI